MRSMLENPRLLPIVAAAVTFAVHCVPGNSTLVGWDEWILAGISARIAAWWLPNGDWYDVLVPTGYGYPPLFFWLGGIPAYLFGPSFFLLRLPTALSAAACSGFATVLAKRASGTWAAFATAMLSVTAVYLNFHNTVSMDFTLAIFVLASLYCFLRGWDEGRARLVWLAVFLGGAACFTKYHGVVYHAYICALVPIVPQARAMLRGTGWFKYAASALAFPAALLALEGLTWRFYGFQKTHIAEALRMGNWQAFAAHPLTGEIITPGWSYYPVYFFLNWGPLLLILTAAGLLIALKDRNKTALVLGAFIVLWFLWAEVLAMKHARYLIPAVYPAMVLAGVSIAAMARSPRGRHYAALALAVLAIGTTWRLYDRITNYRTKVHNFETVYEALESKIPKDALILSDFLPMQKWDGAGLSPITQPVTTPQAPNWQDAEILITQENAADMIERGVIPAAGDYTPFRNQALKTWEVIEDTGIDRERIRVLRQFPNAPAEP